jgi:hypothetical protein
MLKTLHHIVEAFGFLGIRNPQTNIMLVNDDLPMSVFGVT